MDDADRFLQHYFLGLCGISLTKEEEERIIDREITVRQIIKELNLPVKLTSLELIKRVKEISARLRSLEARIENVIGFDQGDLSEFSRGVEHALRKVLGEEE